MRFPSSYINNRVIALQPIPSPTKSRLAEVEIPRIRSATVDGNTPTVVCRRERNKRLCSGLLAEVVGHRDSRPLRDRSASALGDGLCERIVGAHRDVRFRDEVDPGFDGYAGAHGVCDRRLLGRAERRADGEAVRDGEGAGATGAGLGVGHQGLFAGGRVAAA